MFISVHSVGEASKRTEHRVQWVAKSIQVSYPFGCPRPVLLLPLCKDIKELAAHSSLFRHQWRNVLAHELLEPSTKLADCLSSFFATSCLSCVGGKNKHLERLIMPGSQMQAIAHLSPQTRPCCGQLCSFIDFVVRE